MVFGNNDGRTEKFLSRWQVILIKQIIGIYIKKNTVTAYWRHTVITLDILLSINAKEQINITVMPTLLQNLFFKFIIKIINYYCSELTLLMGFKCCDQLFFLNNKTKKPFFKMQI